MDSKYCDKDPNSNQIDSTEKYMYINIMQIIMYEMHFLQNKKIDYTIESTLKYNWINN